MEYSGEQPKKNCKALNILLVEDNDADVKITKRAFKQARIQNNVYIVGNGQDCLDFLQHKGAYQDQDMAPRPDLILLDISMPKVDGFEVLQNLKNAEAYKSIPVIILSGSKNSEDINRAFLNGANSFIQKPVSYEDFVQVIDVFNQYWNVLNQLPGREG